MSTKFSISGSATVLVFALAGCSAGYSSPPQAASALDFQPLVRHSYGIGPTVKPRLPGTILGYDINQHGNDGVFGNYGTHSLLVSLETFDETTGKITKVVAKGNSAKINYVVEGILAHDLGFVSAKGYRLMNPVTGEKLNGKWTPPNSFQVSQIAENQQTPKQVMLGYDTSQPSQPTALMVTDVAKGTAKEIALDQNIFSTGAIPSVAQDPATDQAVVGADDGGRTTHPTFGIVNLKTGKMTTFEGLGYGGVDGMAIDTKTGTMCTTTADDAGVEFYDLKTQQGFEVLIPGSSGSELHSGTGVAVDSINGLCIVAQPVSGNGTQASAIWTVNEKGNFLEEIQGFNFWFGVTPAINPSKRIGFIENPRPLYGSLTGFSY